MDTFIPNNVNNNSVIIRINVTNRGEDAYETRLFVRVPNDFEYGGSQTMAGKAVGCSASTTKDSNDAQHYIIVCDIANPLEKNTPIRFNLIIFVTNFDTTLTSIDMQMHVNR